jgi:hypothetical protein
MSKKKKSAVTVTEGSSQSRPHTPRDVTCTLTCPDHSGITDRTHKLALLFNVLKPTGYVMYQKV